MPEFETGGYIPLRTLLHDGYPADPEDDYDYSRPPAGPHTLTFTRTLTRAEMRMLSRLLNAVRFGLHSKLHNGRKPTARRKARR